MVRGGWVGIRGSENLTFSNKIPTQLKWRKKTGFVVQTRDKTKR